jgi:anti-sigma-K factor RskA
VDRARATAAELARALPEVKPGPEVWQAIEARTGVLRPRLSRRMGPLGWAAAAAAAVALVLLQRERLEVRRQREAALEARALAETAAQETERLRATIQALEGAAALQREALALLDRPDTRLIPMAPQPGQRGRAVAIVSAAEARAVVVSTSLPPQPGKTYQLWVIRGTAPPRPAGFLQLTAAGTAAGEVDPGLLAGQPPDTLAVSLEPAGGSPAPTQVLLVGKLAG